MARFLSSTPPPSSSQRKNPSKARLRCPEAILFRVASAIACRPAKVLGPVLKPPWLRHLPLARALAWQGSPVDRACAPHLCFSFIATSLFSRPKLCHQGPSIPFSLPPMPTTKALRGQCSGHLAAKVRLCCQPSNPLLAMYVSHLGL